MSKRLITRPSKVRAREEAEGESKMLTKAEMKTLRVFVRLYDEAGAAPSTRDLSREMGLSDLGAQPHLQALARKGAIEEIKELKVVDRKPTPLARQWLKLPG